MDDIDGDGLHESREVWFDGQTITGCANDLHGPYLGRDGWIYWCKGAFAEQNHTLLNGKSLKTTAAHVFRCRIDGGAIEPVATGGMDNPVEVAITPEGERFFTSTFLQNPGNGLRDGIAHAIYGGVYGKQHNVIDGHVRTGPLMPIMTQLGPAAPSGLTCLNSSGLIEPKESGERTLVAALFNLQKVTAHTLKPNGASFTTIDRDLVVADRIDFHPTDILEDADGSLIIVDTGGWYDLCCPTSRIDQKTAAGGVYRLSRKGKANAQPKSLRTPADASPVAKLSTDQTVSRLNDDRPWIARTSLIDLAQLKGEEASKAVALLSQQITLDNQTLTHRLNALWGLCSIGSNAALEQVSRAVNSTDPSIAQAACHVVSLHRFKPAKQNLENALSSRSPSVRRAAAEALGRIGDASSVNSLMKGLDGDSFDRILQHSITYALIELEVTEPIERFAKTSSTARQQQTAMIALDQLRASDKLSVEFMLNAIDSPDTQCAQTAASLLANHSDWAPKFASAIAERIHRSTTPDAVPASMLTILRGWKDTETVQQWVASQLEQAPQDLQKQTQLTAILEMYSGTPLPQSWDPSIARWLSSATAEVRSQIISLLTKMDLSKASQTVASLQHLAVQAESILVKLDILAALPVGTRVADRTMENAILDSLTSSDTAESQAASAAMRKITLSLESSNKLLGKLAQLSPRDLAISVEAIHRTADTELDHAMLQLLPSLPSARTLSMDQLLNLYRNRGEKLKSLAESSINSLSKTPSDVEAKIDEVLAKLGPGDPIRGLQLFRSSKTACSSCHRLGYVGGEIGPELSRIGASRTRRALLEAILFPSARLEQSYQPIRVLTVDGQVYNGIVKNSSTAQRLDLQLSADKTVSIETKDIERQEPSPVSIMPSGMLELLTTEDLADLIALLESGK